MHATETKTRNEKSTKYGGRKRIRCLFLFLPAVKGKDSLKRNIKIDGGKNRKGAYRIRNVNVVQYSIPPLL